ncbi:hypothetical protein HanRHA438_Chr13g0597081 [Helianthus annuus]|nr:hypothetical protein HanRHA438_Chr13g0597081 [Helianthus annuus]
MFYFFFFFFEKGGVLKNLKQDAQARYKRKEKTNENTIHLRYKLKLLHNSHDIPNSPARLSTHEYEVDLISPIAFANDEDLFLKMTSFLIRQMIQQVAATTVYTALLSFFSPL